MSEVKFAGKSLVVQFNHAHTGLGTHIVSDDKELRALSEKFPDRPARISDFIQGPVFTLNIVVAKNGVFCGNISYQITGLPNFTDNPFSTVGNDWKLPETLLSKKDKEKILEIAGKTGEKMKNAGWLGLFGIDVIMNEKSHEIFLLEINARQPASTTCESFLQKSAGKNMTIFEAHILALLGEKINDMQKISDGAQIVVRVKAGQKQSDLRARSLSEAHKRENRSVSARLISEGFAVTEYENTEPNKDLLRIRSEKGIMESHGKMNAVGEKISSLIFKS